MVLPTSQQVKIIVQVCVRLRPLSQKEMECNEMDIVRIMDQKVVILMDPADILNEKGHLGRNRTKEKHYAFDYAFDKEAGQNEIFNKSTKFLIDGIINGYNATVFAYGATGAGKTYTMLGTEENPGNMFLTLKEIFTQIRKYQRDRSYNIRVSFLEIYNEQIRDLIMVSQDFLDLREDPVKGVTVAGLSEVEVDTPEEILDLLIFGNRNRTQEATGANETSSRSHAVLQVIVEHKDKDSGTEAEIRIGKLSLIDLAGSERAARTGNRGIRMIEGANINRSLLALGNCINMLHENAQKGGQAYVPYRDSKLTRLLKDSLGGNCRTVMIANIAPCHTNYEDTHNTLKYANRAKNIKTNVTRNVLNVEYHISKYTNIISQLRAEIADLKDQLQGKQNLPAIGARPSSPPVDISKLKDDLISHFQEEKLCKSKINDMETRMEENALKVLAKQNEIAVAARQSGRESMHVKVLREEVDAINQEVKETKAQAEQQNQKFQSLLKKRDQLKVEWRSAGVKELQMEVLFHMMNDQIGSIDSIDQKRKEKKSENDLKVKELQLTRLQEQIMYRDKLLENARNTFEQEQLQSEQLEDPRIMSLEDMMADESLFPPLQQSYGKATNSLVKNILGPSNNQAQRYGRKSERHQNQTSIGQSGSLPPLGSQQTNSDSKLGFQKKFNLQSTKVEKERQMPNKKAFNINSASELPGVNQHNFSVGSNNNSRLGSRAYDKKIVNNRFNSSKPSSITANRGLYGGGNSLGVGITGKKLGGHQPSKSFAKNIAQMKANLGNKPMGFKGGAGIGKEPSRIVGLERKKNSYQPSPMRGIEERRRSNSGFSNQDNISSTSELTPTGLGRKKYGSLGQGKEPGLAVAGVQMSARNTNKLSSGRGYLKYNKPDLGFGGGSGGTDSVPKSSVALTMAARKKELAKKAENQNMMIEQNKKRVLDALNKQRKKY